MSVHSALFNRSFEWCECNQAWPAPYAVFGIVSLPIGLADIEDWVEVAMSDLLEG